MRLRVPLDDFDLDVDCSSGERVVGLFGPSGSGKTTWLEAVAGLRRSARGYLRCGDRVWLDSDHGVDLPPERRDIGYVPQDLLLFPHRNVRGNLEAGIARARRDGGDIEATFAAVVGVLELEPLLGRDVTGLSGGERQRVALGRALCSGPRLLLLDEPLASLDLELRHRILPFLLRVRDAFRVPILIVSHNPVELQALCDEVIALREGRILTQGQPTEVLTRSDVYRAASSEGFENVVPCKVLDHSEHMTTVRLGEGDSGQEVSILRTDHVPGTRLVIGIPAHDILVAAHRVSGLSARNWLCATIESVKPVDHKQIMTVRLDDTTAPAVVVELTADAVEELESTTGDRVWLIVKSSSIAIYG